MNWSWLLPNLAGICVTFLIIYFGGVKLLESIKKKDMKRWGVSPDIDDKLGDFKMYTIAWFIIFIVLFCTMAYTGWD